MGTATAAEKKRAATACRRSSRSTAFNSGSGLLVELKGTQPSRFHAACCSSGVACVMRPRPGSQGILLDAPRMQTVGTTHVEESFGASGHVRVHLPALLARREDLTIDPALNG